MQIKYLRNQTTITELRVRLHHQKSGMIKLAVIDSININFLVYRSGKEIVCYSMYRIWRTIISQ